MSVEAMNIGLSVSTGLVVLGLILEGGEYLEDHPWFAWLRHRVKMWGSLGFSILVIGIAGEEGVSNSV